MRKTDILDVVSRKLAPFMFLFGLYLVSHGDLSPGGGFQGGVVIASGVILLAMAKGSAAAAALLPLRRLAVTEAVVFGLILAAGFAGVVTGVGFLADVLYDGSPLPVVRTPFVFILNLLIGLKVGAGASLICLHLFAQE